MSAPAITLKIGVADAVDIASLDLSAAKFSTSNQAQDELSLTRVESIDDAPLIAPGEQCDLLFDGTRVFRGWLDASPESAIGKAEQRTYRIVGPWMWLDRVNYRQDWVLGGERVTRASGIVRTGAELDSEDQVQAVDVSACLTDVLDYATSELPENTIDYNASDVSAIDADLWSQEFQDASCATVLRAILRWLPLYATYWDYSGSIPVLRIVNAGATPAETLEETVSDAALTEASLRPRHDMLCGGVDLIQLYTDASTGAVSSSTESYEASEGSDADTLGIGRRFTATIRLRSGSDWIEQLRSESIAGQIGAYLERLHIEATAVLADEALLADRRPGELWGFGGQALSRYASYTSICQEIVRDLLRSSVTLTLGPPKHLGLDDLFRMRKGGGGAGRPPQDQTPPQDGSPPQQLPLSARLQVTITPALAASMGALWRVTTGENTSWHASGESINLTPGNYRVEFTEVNGWVKPTAITGVSLISGASEELEGEDCLYKAIIYKQDGTQISTDASNDVLDEAGVMAWRMLDVSSGGVRKDQIYLASAPFTYEEE